MDSFFKNDSKLFEKITRSEEVVDSLREAITSYLVEIMQKELSLDESRKIPAIIHAINDIERIGVHAENLRDLAEQKIEDRLGFSPMATEELSKMYNDIIAMINVLIIAMKMNNIDEAKLVLEQERRINALRDRFKNNHVIRLENRECNVLSGVVFLDIISNLEKIGDHLTNIAQAVIEGLQ